MPDEFSPVELIADTPCVACGDIIGRNGAEDIIRMLNENGYVIVLREPRDDEIRRADHAIRQLPLSERLVGSDSSDRLRTLRNAWRLIIDAMHTDA